MRSHLALILAVSVSFCLVAGVDARADELETPSAPSELPIYEDGFEDFVGCGDGAILGEEQCDDGNTTSGDGCSNACELEGAFRITQLNLVSPRIVATVFTICQDITSNAPSIMGNPIGPSVNSLYSEAIGPVSSGGAYSLHMVPLLSPLDPGTPTSQLIFHLDATCQEGSPLDSCDPGESPTIFTEGATNLTDGTCFTPVVADVNTRTGTPAAYVPTANTVGAQCFYSEQGELLVDVYGLAVPLHHAHMAATYTGSPVDGLVSGVITGFLPETVAADLVFAEADPILGGQRLYSTFQAGDRTVLDSLGASIPDGCNIGGGTHEDDADVVDDVTGFWFFLNFTAEQVNWTVP
jgi:cysteine-rich repeat protein